MRLPEETRAALLVVAVIGAPALELVEAAGIAVELLTPAVAEHVLELAGGEARFGHPLLASGVIAEATEAERRSGAPARGAPQSTSRSLVLAISRRRWKSRTTRRRSWWRKPRRSRVPAERLRLRPSSSRRRRG